MIKKRILTMILLLLGICGTALAQNAIFNKYAAMDNVKYVSIGKSMLDQMVQSGKSTIGGVDIRGLGPGMPLTGILIISTSDPAVGKQIRADEETLANSTYANMVITQNGQQHRSASYFHEATPNSELVMFVTDGDEHTLIVLIGTFRQNDIERMFL